MAQGVGLGAGSNDFPVFPYPQYLTRGAQHGRKKLIFATSLFRLLSWMGGFCFRFPSGYQ
jgi:hypothetical protein